MCSGCALERSGGWFGCCRLKLCLDALFEKKVRLDGLDREEPSRCRYFTPEAAAAALDAAKSVKEFTVMGATGAFHDVPEFVKRCKVFHLLEDGKVSGKQYKDVMKLAADTGRLPPMALCGTSHDYTFDIASCGKLIEEYLKGKTMSEARDRSEAGA